MRANRHPLRKVVKSHLRSGQGGLMMRSSVRFAIRWYELELECGHRTERPCRYQVEHPTRGFARMHHPPPLSAVLPAQARVRCEECSAHAREPSRAMKG